MLLLKLIWVGIGLAILLTVGLTTYGLIEMESRRDQRSMKPDYGRQTPMSDEPAKLLANVSGASLARVSIAAYCP